MNNTVESESFDVAENDIAIISMAGRFPGAKNLSAFWGNLLNAQDSLQHFSDDQLREAGIEEALIHNPHYVKTAGILDEIDKFDADFFNMTPYEASITDPQHRLFLEIAWEALETAGYSHRKNNSLIGVFAGMSDSSYLQNCLLKNNKFLVSYSHYQSQIATSGNFLATKLSYHLNLTGPSININTACSTSLVSVIMACQSLLTDECDIAIAGGVSLRIPQVQGYLYQEGGILSKDGKCRAFDKESTGTVSSSGAGLVVLKRLSDALKDKDSIDAVIKSYAINNDGANKVGYTAPSILEQSRCIATALTDIDAESIGYIETHGTGTALGDPIEITALTKAFAHYTDKKNYCAIASVKTNIGHANIAAGIAGLIKTVLMLKNKIMPATLYFQEANPQINFLDSPFYVNSILKPWKKNGYPRRAGVSSFGIGGTNTHVVLEETPNYPLPSKNKTRQHQVLLLSAKSKTALKQMISNLSQYLKSINTKTSNETLANIAFTLQLGRWHFRERYALVCSTLTEAIIQIENNLGSFASLNKNNSVLKTIDPSLFADSTKASQALAQLWLEGADIDWMLYHGNLPLRRLPLPTYPFEKKRYWIFPDAALIKNAETMNPEVDLANCFYQTSWHRLHALDVLQTIDLSACKDKSWLIFGSDKTLTHQLIEKLRLLEADVVSVYSGSSFEHRTDTYTLDPKNATDYRQLFTAVSKKTDKDFQVIHLWGVDGKISASDSNVVSETLYQGLYSILFLVKAFGDLSLRNKMNILLVSDFMQSIFSEETVCPTKATVLGACQVIPLEYSKIQISSLDIIEKNVSAKAWASYLIAETLKVSTQTEAKQLAYRSGYSWEKRFAPLNLKKEFNSKNQSIIFKDNGVYIITGGLGGIGLSLAKQLATMTSAHIALIARSLLPESKEWQAWLSKHTEEHAHYATIETLAFLQAQGVSFSLHTADVACYKQMLKVVNTIENKIGTIRGIIHAAGLPGSGLIHKKTPEDIHNILQAKLYGTYVLAQLFKAKVLDFVLLFSSLTSLTGSMGQFDYSAANAALDAFPYAHCFHDQTLVTTINWNGWRETGMLFKAFNAPENSAIGPKELNRNNTLLAKEGLLCLIFSLERKLNHLIVSRFPINKIIQDKINNTLTLQGGAYESNPDATENPESLEQKIISIFQNVLGIANINADDDFFYLGGDSLTALSLIDALEKKCKARVSLNQIYELRTPSQLLTFINKSIAPKSESPIVLLNAAGNLPALFLVHPVGGTIVCYMALSHQLKNQTIYAIQDPGLIQPGYHFATLEAMAAYYLSEIQKIQAYGPYYLGGYSMGGTLAFEIAHQLSAKGEEVAFLALFDSWAIFTDEFSDQYFFEKKMHKHLQDSERKLSALLGDHIQDWLKSQWQRMQLLLKYKPSVLDCEITLFKAAISLPEYTLIDNPCNHWQAYSHRPIQVFKVFGDHDTLLSRVNIETLVAQVLDYLVKQKNKEGLGSV